MQHLPHQVMRQLQNARLSVADRCFEGFLCGLQYAGQFVCYGDTLLCICRMRASGQKLRDPL